MTLTVDALVSDPSLDLRIIAGSAGSDREIRWAHPNELLEPDPWLRGGELLLTTGLGLQTCSEVQESYIRRLAQADVAALAFGVGLTFDRVPEAMVAAAEQVRLPIVEVPRPIPFIAITEAVARKLAHARHRKLQQTLKMQQLMTSSLLEHGAQGVLNALVRFLDCSVLLMDDTGAVLVGAGPDCADLAESAQLEISRRTLAPGPFSMANWMSDRYLLIQSLNRTAAGGARLVVGCRNYDGADIAATMAFANSLLSIELGNEALLASRNRVLHGEVVRSLVLGSAGDLSALFEPMGFAPDTEIRVLALSNRVPTSLPPTHLLRQALPDDRRAIRCTIDDVEVIVAEADAVGGRDLERAARRHGRALAIGCSAACSIGDVRTGYTQAMLAMRAAAIESYGFRCYDELTMYSRLLSMQSPTSLEFISTAALQPLVDHDRGQRGDILHSLEVFLANNGQWSAAAAELGVHRHTLRNRMKTIEELTGRSLESVHDRTELWLALKARELAWTAAR